MHCVTSYHAALYHVIGFVFSFVHIMIAILYFMIVGVASNVILCSVIPCYVTCHNSALHDTILLLACYTTPSSIAKL